MNSRAKQIVKHKQISDPIVAAKINLVCETIENISSPLMNTNLPAFVRNCVFLQLQELDRRLDNIIEFDGVDQIHADLKRMTETIIF